MTKVCNTCHVDKPLTDFYKSTRDGVQGHCKTCHRARQKAYQPGAPREQAARQRKSRYGLSAEEYIAMVLAQDGACAICHEVKPLCVDHNHETGNVRKLLCHHCNRALGLLQDNPYLLARAADYLKEH